MEMVPAKEGSRKGRGKEDGPKKKRVKEEKLRTGSLVSGVVKEAHQLFVVLQLSEGTPWDTVAFSASQAPGHLAL